MVRPQKRLRNVWTTLTPLGQLLLLALLIPLLLLNGWALLTIATYFHSLVAILVGASLLAFLLNYPVTYMQRRGANRGRAVIFVFLLALAVLLGLAITLLPMALHQAEQFVTRLPEWLNSGQRQLSQLNNQVQGSGLPFSLDVLIGQLNTRLTSQLESLSGEALHVAVFTFTSLLDFLLTLVLAFYLLQHGDRIWHSLIEWLPPHMQQPFAQTLHRSFQSFFLGQFILATCMGLTLTCVFLIMRVPFGLLFGLAIGSMALIPFGGSVGIFSVTVLIALRDVTLALKVLLVCVLVQQILENGVAPRILGSVTGLNPVWVFVAILTGARVGGLLGVIVAVPMAVVIKSALVAIRIDRASHQSLAAQPEGQPEPSPKNLPPAS